MKRLAMLSTWKMLFKAGLRPTRFAHGGCRPPGSTIFHLPILFGILVIAALVAGAGYLGYRSAQDGGNLDLGAELDVVLSAVGLRPQPAQVTTAQTPPTVPVTRGDVEQTVTAPGRLVSAEFVLGLSVGGRLVEVNVRPGDAVCPGDVLARLDTTDLETQVSKAQEALTLARAELRQARAKAQPTAEEIELAKVDLERARIALQKAQAAYDRIAWRGDAALSPEAGALEQATLDYRAAQVTYQIKTRQPADTEFEVYALKVKQAEVALAQAEAELGQAVLKAPAAGTVLEVRARPGENVAAGTGLIVLADLRAVEVRVTVVEEDLPLVQAGQAVALFFDAQPDLEVQGRVARIVPQRVSGQDRPLYPVYVAVDGLPASLLPGMTVDGSIVVAQRTNVLRLPRAMVRVGPGGTAQVEVWRNGQAQKRTIKVGLRGDTYVEVLEGLQEGELVVGR